MATYKLFARFTGTYSMEYGTDLSTYLDGKPFNVYEISGSQSQSVSITYVKGGAMRFRSLKGNYITFTLAVSLMASSVGVQSFTALMSKATEAGTTQITITDPAGKKVLPPVIQWNRDEHAIWYPDNPEGSIGAKLVYSDGSYELIQAGQDSFYEPDLWGKAAGDYSFRAYADGIQSGYWYDDSPSDPISVSVAEQEDPNIRYDGGKYEWDDVGTRYTLYVGGTAVYTGTATEYASARKGDAYVRSHEYWDESKSSRSGGAVFHKERESNHIRTDDPYAPTIAAMASYNTTLSWSNLTDDATYVIYRDGEMYASTQGSSYQIKETEAGLHSYYVVATLGDKSSSPSNTISKTFRKLDKPKLSVYELAGRYYARIRNSYSLTASYALKAFINGTPYPMNLSSETVIDITDMIKAGRNDITAVAATERPTIYLESDPDYATITKVGADWVATIDGKDYGVQHPISILPTANETLDTASIILDIKDVGHKKEPFEAYVPVVLTNFTDEGDVRLKMTFLIEKDSVKQKLYGDDKRYLHELTLIEETKKLQAIIMPDITITQPLSLAGKIGSEATGDPYGRSYRQANPYFIGESSDIVYQTSYYWGIYSTGVSQVISNIQDSISVGYEGLLPDWNIEGLQVCFTERETDFIVFKSVRKKYIREYHPTKTVLIRKRANGEAKWTREAALSNIKGNRSAFVSVQSTDETYGKLTYKFSELADYDIYLYAEPIFDGRISNGMDPSELPPVFNQFLLQGARGITEEPNIVGMALGDGNPMSDDEFLYCFTTSTGRAEDSDAITVGDALEKVINAVKPIRLHDGLKSLPPFRYECTHSTDVCYESTWSGGKTLYEILSDIGKQFKGTPRLDGDTIKFDIVGETLVGNPLWVDTDTLEKEASDMDTQARTLITQAKNIISEDDWETYPSEDGWITCRSSDPDDPYCTKANSVIRLPRKIFQIRSIYVKDMKTGAVYSIFQEHCLESTLWNLLADDRDGKGSCLTYTRGDDKIENIGALVKNDTYELWGLSPDEYVIQNILATITGASSVSFDPNDLAYRVTYKPYTDQVIRVEQPMGRETQPCELAFNQDCSIASDSKLGDVMEDKVSRLGNNTIQKMSRSGIDGMPTLGQVIERNGARYYLTKVNHLIERTFVESTMEFSRDRSSIDVSVGLNSEYRQYEITADDFVTRQISVDQYAICSTDAVDGAVDMQRDIGYSTAKAIAGALNGNPAKRPTDFYIAVGKEKVKSVGISLKKKIVFSPLEFTNFAGGRETCKGFLLHADFHAIGNQVVFNAKALDNYSMGVCAYELEDTGTAGNSGRYIQKDCRYVDDMGNTPLVRVCLGRLSDQRLTIVDSTISPYRSLPYARHTDNPYQYMGEPLLNEVFSIDKDNREALSFQYALHFISDTPKVEVRSALSRNLFAKDGALPSVMCVRTGDISSKDTLNPSDIKETIPYSIKTDGANIITISTECDDWALCVNDGKIRPMLVAKGTDTISITVSDSPM